MIEALNRMPAYRRLVTWQWSHNSLAIDLIRMFMGVALLIRGVAFLSDPEILEAFAGDRAVSAAKYYIIWSHIIGGGLLLVGLFTRIAALSQIPILVVAVFFVHLPGGFATENQSLELSALVLVVLSVLAIYGAGKYSLDYRIFYRDLTASPGG
ncbi:MAG: DoxX family protein [Rhodothermales bacterium]|nr:DoxX family protein [Rhodothermales bacterium]MBO6778121.1 DoxX family protein [Rhodothermales bacterium]